MDSLELETLKKKHKTWISSEHKWYDLHLKELVHYRDLLVMFIKRNFITKYKQTILGPAWAVIQPLLTTIVHTYVFGNLARLTTLDVAGDYIVPGFLFYMSGTICWNYFSSTLSATADTFLQNAGILGKVYFPRIIMPLSTAMSGFISFAIQYAVFALICMLYLTLGGTSIAITPAILLVPLTFLQMIILSVGCGIVVSSATTKYRDLKMLVVFGIQLWQYGTPVVYGLQLVPEQLRWLYMLNPTTSIITTFRYGMFGFGYFNIAYYLLSWVISLLIFFIGVVMFNKIERTFMDTI